MDALPVVDEVASQVVRKAAMDKHPIQQVVMVAQTIAGPVAAACVVTVVMAVVGQVHIKGGKLRHMDIKENESSWQSGMAKNITFIVTKDCQLACKYCYLVGKNAKERMPFEIAKQAIDYILDHEDDFREESVVWDFIGG